MNSIFNADMQLRILFSVHPLKRIPDHRLLIFNVLESFFFVAYMHNVCLVKFLPLLDI